MSDAAAGPAAAAAAASERASEAPLAASSGAPAAAHSAATCPNNHAWYHDTHANPRGCHCRCSHRMQRLEGCAAQTCSAARLPACTAGTRTDVSSVESRNSTNLSAQRAVSAAQAFSGLALPAGMVTQAAACSQTKCEMC